MAKLDGQLRFSYRFARPAVNLLAEADLVSVAESRARQGLGQSGVGVGGQLLHFQFECAPSWASPADCLLIMKSLQHLKDQFPLPPPWKVAERWGEDAVAEDGRRLRHRRQRRRGCPGTRCFGSSFAANGGSPGQRRCDGADSQWLGNKCPPFGALCMLREAVGGHWGLLRGR